MNILKRSSQQQLKNKLQPFKLQRSTKKLSLKRYNSNIALNNQNKYKQNEENLINQKISPPTNDVKEVKIVKRMQNSNQISSIDLQKNIYNNSRSCSKTKISRSLSKYQTISKQRRQLKAQLEKFQNIIKRFDSKKSIIFKSSLQQVNNEQTEINSTQTGAWKISNSHLTKIQTTSRKQMMLPSIYKTTSQQQSNQLIGYDDRMTKSTELPIKNQFDSPLRKFLDKNSAQTLKLQQILKKQYNASSIKKNFLGLVSTKDKQHLHHKPQIKLIAVRQKKIQNALSQKVIYKKDVGEARDNNIQLKKNSNQKQQLKSIKIQSVKENIINKNQNYRLIINLYQKKLLALQQKLQTFKTQSQSLTQYNCNLNQKIELLLQKTHLLQTIAQQINKHHLLSSLPYWKKALKQYIKTNAIIHSNKNINTKQSKFNIQQNITLGEIRCLLKLHRYQQALKILQKSQLRLLNSYKYWKLFSQYERKVNRIEKAKQKLQKAKLILNQKGLCQGIIQKQEKFIEVLQTNNYKVKIKETHSKRDIILDSKPKKLSQKYKILSIDGGGWRGVLTAFWLSQLENKLRKPTSQMFNMAAGTSVGSMITGGMTLPAREGQSWRPRYTASDIVLGLQQDAHIFFQPSGLFSVLSSKFKDQGRQQIFNKYCSDTRISQSLIDLVIPAVHNNNMGYTHIFTSREAKINPQVNVKFYDAVMASTSAPTFFHVHHIEGLGNFVDGGLQVNNPSRLALNQALKYGYKSDDIYMLSLGTGAYDYVKTVQSDQKDRNLLYWASNISNFILAGQQANTDLDVSLHLSDRYHRWQFWLDKPIALDDWDSQSTNQLLGLANQHIQQLYAYDDNRMNKLLQVLDD